MAEKSKNKYLAIGAVVVGVFLVVWVVNGTLAKKSLLQDSLNKLIKADTYHVVADLDLDLALNPEEESVKKFNSANVRVEGDVKYNEESVPELTGKLYMESRGRGNVFFVDGDARILSDQVAFKLDNLPALMNNSVALVDKWTYVDGSVLTTNNKEAVMEAFRLTLQDMEYVDKEELDGEDMYRYSGRISPDLEEKLISVTQKDSSGNSALHILTRLLRHNDADSLDIWIDKSDKELALIRVNFVRPVSDEETPTFATLDLKFSDYNKNVVIDRPEQELTVQPSVFSRLFGEGKMELQAANTKK